MPTPAVQILPPWYRAVNFKERILWPLAQKLGADPKKELLVDEASAFVSYINAWVRKSWDSVDWPEWTLIQAFTPDPVTHRVPLIYAVNYPGTQLWPILQQISRVFKVYLCDPDLYHGPIETPFFIRAGNSVSGSGSVHCGFEHGANVYIKYILSPPQFTAEQWNPNINYQAGQLTYSPVTGECYMSVIQNNIGFDPKTFGFIPGLPAGVPPPPDTRFLPEQQGPPIPLNVAQTQFYAPGTAAVTGQPEIWSEAIGVNNWYTLLGTLYTFQLADATGARHTFSYTTASAGMTIGAVMTAIAAAAAASTDTWVQALTFTQDLVNNLLLIHNATAFSDTGSVATKLGGLLTQSLNPINTQTYKAMTPATTGIPQQFMVYLSPPNWIAGSTYQVMIRDVTGILHLVTYVSQTTDTTSDVVNGVLAGFNADPFLASLPVVPDHLNMTLAISSPIQQISVSAQWTPPANTNYWLYIPFPFALADIVLQGAYADALREWGQAEKAVAADKAALMEGQARASSFLGPTFDRLTDQQQPKPKYMIPPEGQPAPQQSSSG